MPRNKDIKKVLVIGSGPIIIGQAAEFDYAGTQACRSLKEEGIEVVLLNSNPATIMTDKDIADRVYIEPLTIEVVEQLIKKEKPDSVLPTLGGQAALNLAMELDHKGILKKYGTELLGVNRESIKKAEDREEFKKSIVLQYTWNRTDSLKEMTAKEYEACCTALEKLSGQDEWREELRRNRSLCLNLMQKLGIDTSDWARINDFCSNPRIVGKAFRQITVDELDELAVKLRSIQRKGGLKPRKEKQTINPVSMVSLIQIDPDAPAN